MNKILDKPNVYQYDFKNEDGSTDVWKYNMNVTRHGPVEVTHIPLKVEPVKRKKKNKYVKDDDPEV